MIYVLLVIALLEFTLYEFSDIRWSLICDKINIFSHLLVTCFFPYVFSDVQCESTTVRFSHTSYTQRVSLLLWILQYTLKADWWQKDFPHSLHSELLHDVNSLMFNEGDLPAGFPTYTILAGSVLCVFSDGEWGSRFSHICYFHMVSPI